MTAGHMASVRNVVSKIPRLSSPNVPDKLKGGRIERIGLYFKNILQDYKDVAFETWQDMKDRPVKTAIIFSSLGGMWYLAKHNPDETSFRTHLLENVTEIATVGEQISNPTTVRHIQTIVNLYNSGQMRYLNLGIFSLMWADKFDKEVDLYEAQAKPLKVGWMDLPERVMDFGILDRWLRLEKAMVDYDINPTEWGEKERVDIIPLKY